MLSWMSKFFTDSILEIFILALFEFWYNTLKVNPSHSGVVTWQTSLKYERREALDKKGSENSVAFLSEKL